MVDADFALCRYNHALQFNMTISFKHSDMLDSVPKFLDLYKHRPITKNSGGMGFNHSWATWFLVKELQPELIVESGIWRGHSTWLLEHSAPSARIISFDLDLSKRLYTSERVEYHQGDFMNYAWDKCDLSNSLIFLDDHQNHYERLIKCSWLGALRVILEDNYPVGEGDFYSLKHMAAGTGATSIQMSKSHQGNLFSKFKRGSFEFLLNRIEISQNRLVRPNRYDWQNLQRRLKTSMEMPPVYLESRTKYWNTEFRGNYTAPVPLLTSPPDASYDYSYNWLTYVELKEKATQE